MSNQKEQLENNQAAKAYSDAMQKHFYVKKRALFRKAEQIAKFCNCEIFVSVYNNETGKVFCYTSDEKFSLEKISSLVLRDVQDGPYLSKNKKFEEEDFEKIKRNIERINKSKDQKLSLDHEDAKIEDNSIESSSDSQKSTKQFEQPKIASPAPQIEAKPENANMASLENILNNIVDEEPEDEMPYHHAVTKIEQGGYAVPENQLKVPVPQPLLNRLSTGLLAMNQARLGKATNKSIISNSATVQYDENNQNQELAHHNEQVISYLNIEFERKEESDLDNQFNQDAYKGNQHEYNMETEDLNALFSYQPQMTFKYSSLIYKPMQRKRI